MASCIFMSYLIKYRTLTYKFSIRSHRFQLISKLRGFLLIFSL